MMRHNEYNMLFLLIIRYWKCPVNQRLTCTLQPLVSVLREPHPYVTIYSHPLQSYVHSSFTNTYVSFYLHWVKGVTATQRFLRRKQILNFMNLKLYSYN